MITIRPERTADEPAIRSLLLDAFGGPVEAHLIEHLREHGAVVVALVAVTADDSLAGTIAFSRLWIETGQRLTPAIALAPLAVAAALRGNGIGGQLIAAGHQRLVALRERLSVVVGDLEFYTRYGYRREYAAGFESAYQRDYLAAFRLAEDAPREGTLRYDPAFYGP